MRSVFEVSIINKLNMDMEFIFRIRVVAWRIISVLYGSILGHLAGECAI
jgi:hypothetical protein